MLKTNERLNLILTMNNYGLDLELLKEAEPEDLHKLCGGLKENKTPREWYTTQIAIQKELLNHERFFFCLKKAVENANIMPYEINGYITTLHEHGKNTQNYPEDRVITSMMAANENNGSNKAFFDFLTCFSGIFLTDEQIKIIITNLDLYGNSISSPIAELSAGKKALFLEAALTNDDLVPDSDGINRIFDLLTQHDGLLDIIRFLYKNNLGVGLGTENYEALCINPDEILEKLKMLYRVLGEEKMYELLERWVENNCPYYDLEVLNRRFNKESGKLSDEESSVLNDILETRSAYINFIYGGRFKAIPLSEVHHYNEDIIIHAITNKKNGFIRLIEENYEAFSSLWYGSILFKRDFYAKHVNINALNPKNLDDCGRMAFSKFNFGDLEADRVYTFEEIKALYDLPVQYYKLYAGLENPSVDKRLITFKQISKRKLLTAVEEDEQVAKLASMLSQKPLSLWREQDFSHIKGLKAPDAVKLLIYMDEAGKLIPQMKTRADVLLVTRNPSVASEYDSLDEMKGALVVMDTAWGNLVKNMNFSEAFLLQNKENVIEFVCKNGADIAHTYYNVLDDDKQRESLKRIVKAVLMGEFSKLKYYADDLRIELDYPVANTQKIAWMENTELAESSGFEVKECDDFYETMLMGEMPQHTCLSYINGMYKECLLSGFDTNKKVLYAYKGGEVVGRAIVRLTKGRFNLPEEIVQASTFSFVDVEAIKDESNDGVTDSNGDGESLILFLERPYAAGISGETEKHIENMYVDLLISKARSMGALLVVSHVYESVVDRKDFVRTSYNVYISKSKAGNQYLDSLNGSATMSDEGGYRSNSFFIHEEALK